MGALDPIAGISLENYAELCAKMADCCGDLDRCAEVAAANGVDRQRWQEAMDGWNARMYDPATAAEVALAYMPLYQAALAQHGPAPIEVSMEQYAEMLAMIQTETTGESKRPTEMELMYEKFGIDAPRWSQISTQWVEKLTKDPELGKQCGDLFLERKQALDREHLERSQI